MDVKLGNRFERIANGDPNRAALIIQRGSLWEPFTYQYLNDIAGEIAGGFNAFGLRAGMRSAFMVPPGLEFFALSLALLKAQIVPVLVDPAIGLAGVKKSLNEAAPEAYFGSPLTNALRLLYGWGKEVIHIPVTTGDLGGIQLRQIKDTSLRSLDTRPYSPESEVAIIFTSGSTGSPKGAVYTQGNLQTHLEFFSRELELGPEEIDLPAFPLFALIDLLLGITSVIPDINFPPPARSDPKKITDAVQQFSVTNLFASPIELDRLAKYGAPKQMRLASLKRVITAGAPAPRRVLEEFSKLLPRDAKLLAIYGATESLSIAMINARELISETGKKTARGAGVCLGKPLKGTRVRVIAPQDQAIPNWKSSLLLPRGKVGEITISGKAVSSAYVGPAEISQNAKIRKGREILHRTGDLGYFDSKGRLWFCGRSSERVETRYGTFFTEQIEGIFNAHPLVFRTALVEARGEPVIWVQLSNRANAPRQREITMELEQLGKKHKLASKVKTFLYHPNFPTDIRHNSKINRSKLAEQARKRLA